MGGGVAVRDEAEEDAQKNVCIVLKNLNFTLEVTVSRGIT